VKILTIFFLVFISIFATAQDKIIKKTGTIIECKVTEIAVDEVKYYYADNPKLIFGIDKVLVEKIEFSTGEVIVMEGDSFKNAEYYTDQHKHALKLNFTAPFMGSTELVYEQSAKPGKSWETALGIVGLGFDPQDINPRGVYGKFAFKFIKTPDFYMQRMHYSHILKGAYFAPEIAMRYVKYDSSYGYYSYSSTYVDASKRKEQFGMAVLLKFGKQWILDDSFLVDLYGGLGYGIGGDDEYTLTYGFIVAPEVPISFSGGLRIGWVF